jgi:hypothetical protein
MDIKKILALTGQYLFFTLFLGLLGVVLYAAHFLSR